MEANELEIRFRYHAPKSDQIAKYDEIRNQARELAYTINLLCPESREQSLAFTHLEECVMQANAAIARRS